MQDLNFSGKTVLVVGGSSGIGNAMAQAFLQQGAAVAVWGTRATAADYAQEAGSQMDGLHYAQVNVADTNAINSCPLPFADLDVLVLSQGTVMYQRAEYEIENFQKILQVNLTSLMACCRRFEAQLERSAGAIIVVSSTAGFHSTPGNPAYNASKTGAVGLTRTLGDAWASKGIRVNGIAPGLVATKLTTVTTGNAQRLEGFLKNVPAGRMGTPEEMASVALFLASPLARYIVGQTLIVDGGLTLR